MNQPDFIAYRRELPHHPELSMEGHETKKRALHLLKDNQPDKIVPLESNLGLLFFNRQPKQGKQVMVRCELDALPIQEVNTIEGRSKTKDKSHKCGHDEHIAILGHLAPILFVKNVLKTEQSPFYFNPLRKMAAGLKLFMRTKHFKSFLLI